MVCCIATAELSLPAHQFVDMAIKEMGFSPNELYSLPLKPAPYPLRQLQQHNNDGTYNMESLFNTVAQIPDRVNDLEARTRRIEDTLNLILERFRRALMDELVNEPPNRNSPPKKPPVNGQTKSKTMFKRPVFSRPPATQPPATVSLVSTSPVSQRGTILRNSPYCFQPPGSSRDQLLVATRDIISRKQSLDILSGCQNPERLHGLPSWVPNITDAFKAIPFQNPIRSSDLGHAGGDMVFGFDKKDDSVLQANGRLVGSIKVCSVDGPGWRDSDKRLEALCANWRHLAAQAASSSKFDPESTKMLDDLNGPARYQHWLGFISLGVDFGQNREPEYIKLEIFRHLHDHGAGRKLCFLDSGNYGLVPADSKPGDLVCFFPRTYFPYILRKTGRGKSVVVGEACKYTSSS